MNNELLKQCKDEVAKRYCFPKKHWFLTGDGWCEMESFLIESQLMGCLCKRYIEVYELYSSRQSQQLQERVERMEKALHWAKDVIKRLGNEGKYPEFLLQINGGNGMEPILSALSGEATKENNP